MGRAFYRTILTIGPYAEDLLSWGTCDRLTKDLSSQGVAIVLPQPFPPKGRHRLSGWKTARVSAGLVRQNAPGRWILATGIELTNAWARRLPGDGKPGSLIARLRILNHKLMRGIRGTVPRRNEVASRAGSYSHSMVAGLGADVIDNTVDAFDLLMDR